MTKLICFPMSEHKMNLVAKIGVKYYEFGILLLEDESGDQVSAIEKELRGNASDITREIFRLWLQGRGRFPVSWDTLTAVLQDIGLRKLAKDIKEVHT